MSLSQDTLASALTEAFNPYPDTVEECAQRWHVAYTKYARESSVSYGGFTSNFLPTGEGSKDSFIANITTAFTVTTPYDPMATLMGMANAFSSFWLASINELFPPVGVQLIPITCIPNPDISAFLNMSFVNGTAQDAAIKMIATGVHNYTKGIQVAGTYFQPGTPPIPFAPFTTNIT